MNSMLTRFLRVLVAGAGGYVGSEIVAKSIHQIIPANRKSKPNSIYLNTNEVESIRAALDVIMPDAVVNATGLKDLKHTETTTKATRLANVIGPYSLARESVTRGIKFIEISTNYVFNEMGELRPDTVYGQTKLEAEELILALSRTLRTFVDFSGDGDKCSCVR
jgi:dTDP-4-dehydrorhamnose reductase